MLIGKGAEAYIYLEEMFGRKLIIKERKKKEYRVEPLDSILRAQRTKREAKVLYLINKNNIPAPRLIAVSRFSIYMEYIDGNILRDIEITNELIGYAGSYLDKLHEINIAHGDYTPANLIYSKGKLFIIDFGLSQITNNIEEKAYDLLLMKRSISKELFSIFLEYYDKNKNRDIIERMQEIEKRGRYMIRTLA